ncbi:hypothetical protein TB2_022048 [Malus domestica]
MGLRARVHDCDTNTMHYVNFTCWGRGLYVLNGQWRLEFVLRRGFKEKDQIGLYWDEAEGMFMFSLLERANPIGNFILIENGEQRAVDGLRHLCLPDLTGRPEVLLTVSDPGCVHGLAGLSNTMANAWPMVMILGSCDQKDFGRGDFQELDQTAKAAQPKQEVSFILPAGAADHHTKNSLINQQYVQRH